MTVRRLLIANRGEIACRVIRTARAMGIGTVAVFSDPDAGALHVEQADVAVRLPGATAAETYLDIARLLAAAQRSGADAVHPGYGFLSENPGFASAVQDAGLVWVGPSPDAITVMGDKLAAKQRLGAAGVPVPHGHSPDEQPERWPVVVKAAMGGGGRGMRVVHRREDLADAVAATRREALQAFGDATVFWELYLPRTRHVEVQVMGDHHGALVHLGERECSVQRRYQKVIEESPSPAVTPDVRALLVDTALLAARAVSYTNAGTVEFLLAPDGTVTFLEMNTRLQVEHPVTELAWGLRDGSTLDVVRLQLLVAQGEPLPFVQDDVVQRGHAVEARLYAEDPATEYLPAPGRLDVVDFDDRVRVDTGVRAGDVVGVHYDPLLAKVIAHGPTRREAVALLASALEASRVQGTATNREQLVAVLRTPAFLAGDLHTGFLEDHPVAVDADPSAVVAHLVAATLHQAAQRVASRPLLASIPSGWRNNRAQPQAVAWTVDGAQRVVTYAADRAGRPVGVAVDGQPVMVQVHGVGHTSIDVDVEGLRADVAVAAVGDRVHVSSAWGAVTLGVVSRFPEPGDVAGGPVREGGLTAPMPGTVAVVAVAVGDRVSAGALLVVLEAMKMEHRVTAAAGGTVVAAPVAPGDLVAAGDVLVVLDPD